MCMYVSTNLTQRGEGGREGEREKGGREKGREGEGEKESKLERKVSDLNWHLLTEYRRGSWVS